MLAKIFFFIAMQLAPFYLFPSGTVQLSQMVFIAFSTIVIFKYKAFHFSQKYFNLGKLLIVFVVYIGFIQGYYYMTTDDIVFLKVFIFYLYSLFVFLLMLYVFYKDKAYMKLLYYSSSISLVLLGVLYLALYGTGQPRATLFFNNPNQLAYYVLLNISIVMHLFFNVKISKNRFLLSASLFTSIVLMLASISKAGLAALALLFFIFGFKNKKIFFLAFFLVLVGIFIFIYYSQELQLLQSATDRITNSTGRAHEGFLIERGYIRIFEYPEYLLFGAGEGMNDRFNSILEIHSFFGNIVFSYGIIGLGLFLYFIYYLYKLTSYQTIILLMPLFLYGIVHNSIRNPLFWIYCSLLFVTMRKKINEK